MPPSPLRILHFGDLHVWRAEFVWREAYHPKRWLGPLNLALRRAHAFPPAYRRPVMDAVLAENADIVVFTGDFSTFSLESEFSEAARLFAPLHERYGKRLFAIPGNHDRYTARSLRRKLLEKHLPWVRQDPVSRLDLSNTWTLLGVDHAVPLRFRSNGIVSESTQTALRDELQRLKQQQKNVILAGHFPYATPVAYPESWEHKLLGEEKFAALLREFPPAVYLHGHKHVRWALRPACTPETLCLNCGSIGMKHDNPRKQAGYLLFDLHETGIDNLQEKVFDGQGGWETRPLIPDPA